MRINEIDDFYENNIRDSRVLNFQKIKIKLKKLLTYDPEIVFKNDFNKTSYKGKENNKK